MTTYNSRMQRKAQRDAVSVYRSGPSCVCTPNESRRKEGHHIYKKGWEIRVALTSRKEAADAARTLARAGLRPGRPYPKSATRWILPVYGRDATKEFLKWVAEAV